MAQVWIFFEIIKSTQLSHCVIILTISNNGRSLIAYPQESYDDDSLLPPSRICHNIRQQCV